MSKDVFPNNFAMVRLPAIIFLATQVALPVRLPPLTIPLLRTFLRSNLLTYADEQEYADEHSFNSRGLTTWSVEE
jgi:hypothetical protein